ncbi:putative betaine-aldehyde dehydrogenase [Helianthus annuus]|uniref:Betaine-aldehyde dehydrogenase n=1 Tax=Helianthus annuus TaxID=4232 RepID=A0A9K3J1E1_HELAN|nr:putative betaine-aldehyde dehydrogenase [Helianthus annuus]KAJ0585263.1 putative betaine-aldehyde dehydrogenase [Helianthus annuus]KAJ0919760.1 putative betaine-aldehyde dehydrogenase [Helianthus annuus]
MEGDLITSYRGGFSGLDVTAVESNEDLDVMRFAFEGGIVCVNYSYPCFSQAPWGGKERIDLAVNLENGDLRIT